MVLKHYTIIDIGEQPFKFDNDIVSNYEEQTQESFLSAAKKALSLKYKTQNFYHLTTTVPETEICRTIEQYIQLELSKIEQITTKNISMFI